MIRKTNRKQTYKGIEYEVFEEVTENVQEFIIGHLNDRIEGARTYLDKLNTMKDTAKAL